MNAANITVSPLAICLSVILNTVSTSGFACCMTDRLHFNLLQIHIIQNLDIILIFNRRCGYLVVTNFSGVNMGSVAILKSKKELQSPDTGGDALVLNII